jgi:hypothetical protein
MTALVYLVDKYGFNDIKNTPQIKK